MLSVSCLNNLLILSICKYMFRYIYIHTHISYSSRLQHFSSVKKRIPVITLRKRLRLLLYFFCSNVTAQDPCTNYEWIKNPSYRGSNCPSIDKKELCDKYDIDSKWYRVRGDTEIITEKVDILKCATEFPIWINGKNW